MDRKKKIITSAVSILLIAVILLLLFNSLGFKRDSPSTGSVKYVDSALVSIDGGEFRETSLPAKFDHLKPGTPVTLKTTIRPDTYDGVYIKSLYTNADVYFDDKLVFSFGKKENYPDFMINPSAEIHIIETYGTGEEMEVRIEYSAPCKGHTLYIETPMVGTSKELILERSTKYGMSWVMSIILIAIGVALLLVYVFIRLIEKKSVLFLWLGLFSISAGFWFYNFNEFTITVLPDTTWQYVTSYLGYSAFVIPLIVFTKKALNLEESIVLSVMEMFYRISLFVSLLLQLLKIVPLHISWYFFYYTVPVAILILTVIVVREYLSSRRGLAAVFIIPTVMLLISIVVENIHNPLYIHLSSVDFFQVGVVLYLLIMGIIAGMTIRESFRLEKMKEALDHEKAIIDIQTEEQKEEGLRLAASEQTLSRQRHDLRHHLVMLQELTQDNKEIQDYIAVLIDKIPKSEERFCENNVVNAILSHYASLYRTHGIRFEHTLSIPSVEDKDLQSDLCAIFANLLENADEACMRMKSGEKFVRLKSSMQFNLLTVTMDNSFEGTVRKNGSRFASSKRDDFGIGIASIQSIVKARHGDSSFTDDENIFHSSFYIRLEP